MSKKRSFNSFTSSSEKDRIDRKMHRKMTRDIKSEKSSMFFDDVDSSDDDDFYENERQMTRKGHKRDLRHMHPEEILDQYYCYHGKKS